MIRARTWRQALACGAVVALAAFGFIGLRGLWEPDEGRYVAVALQMLWSGDWLHPALHDDLPHLAKPPLTYWSIASAMALFGHSEWSIRLPGASAFALTAAMVGCMARRMARGRELLASMIYATSALPFLASNIITADTILTMCESLGVLGFVLATPAWWSNARLGDSESPTPRATCTRFDRRGLALMWIGFGLAFFTKGPPGLLPLASIGAMTLLHRGPKQVIRLLDPIGVLAFLLIAGWWFALLISEDHALLKYFVAGEVYQRIFTTTHGRNSQWYMALGYLPLVFAGMLPWSLGWLNAAWRSRRRRAGALVPRMREPAMTFLILWTTIPLAAFMLAPSRLALYVVPVMPPLALLTARLYPRSWLRSSPAWVSMVSTLGILVLVRVALGVAPLGRDAREMARTCESWDSITEIVFVDARPSYGLAFYSQAPVERVVLDAAPGDESLAEELDEEAGDLMLVFDSRARDRIERILEAKHWRPSSPLTLRSKTMLHVAPPRVSSVPLMAPAPA